MDLSKETMRRLQGLILFAAIVVACVWKYEVALGVLVFIYHVLFPFLLGGAIAFVLNVPMGFVERHLFSDKHVGKSKLRRKLARPVSMLLVIFGVLGLLMLVMFVLIPQLGDTFAALGNTIQEFIPRAQAWAEAFFHSNPDIVDWINSLTFDWNQIADTMMDFLKNGTGDMLGSTISVAKNIVSGVATFFIAFVFAIYILLQKEKLGRQVKKVLLAFVPKKRADGVLKVASLTYSTFSSFLTGQCVEALILGGMFVLAMTILQLPYALLVGIVIAFTALLPIFGAFIGCLIGAFLIFMVSPAQALIFLILFLILQQIEGNLIYPHVVGNSVGLPSIWVLAAVSVGASLMGVVGMLIFIPIVSVLYALFREMVYLKLRERRIDPKDIQ